MLPGPLTSREIEVGRLVAGGLTNRQVAGKLVISKRTVDSHIEHIFAKLGLSSRTELAAILPDAEAAATQAAAARRTQAPRPGCCRCAHGHASWLAIMPGNGQRPVLRLLCGPCAEGEHVILAAARRPVTFIRLGTTGTPGEQEASDDGL